MEREKREPQYDCESGNVLKKIDEVTHEVFSSISRTIPEE